jgi:hypothetical protein
MIVNNEIENSEASRYGRDKSLTIDHTYIESGEFRRKFDKISDNKELNRNLYQVAKAMLKHRSGTEFEDMYWLDAQTGKVFAEITDMCEPNKVVYSSEFMGKYGQIAQKVTIHNHPRSMPPSIGDFESAYRNCYSNGIVVCHDGTLFLYKNITAPSESLYDELTDDNRSLGYSEYTSEKMALTEMASRGLIVFKEV